MDRKERRKAGKEFEKQIVDQTKSQNDRQAKKAEFKKMPFYKKMIGYLVVPILLAMWIIDRILHIMLPLKSHANIKVYFGEPSNIKFTFARIIIFGLPVLIFWLIFRNF